MKEHGVQDRGVDTRGRGHTLGYEEDVIHSGIGYPGTLVGDVEVVPHVYVMKTGHTNVSEVTWSLVTPENPDTHINN